MGPLKQFRLSHACMGTVGVCFAVLLIAWPPALSWLTAGCLLCWAASQLRESFRLVDADSPASGDAVRLRHREPAGTVVPRPATMPDVVSQ
jgi:hypothetical protein